MKRVQLAACLVVVLLGAIGGRAGAQMQGGATWGEGLSDEELMDGELAPADSLEAAEWEARAYDFSGNTVVRGIRIVNPKDFAALDAACNVAAQARAKAFCLSSANYDPAYVDVRAETLLDPVACDRAKCSLRKQGGDEIWTCPSDGFFVSCYGKR